MIGKVTSATLSEESKTMWIVVTMEDGTSRVLNRDVSEDELHAYKAHPDAYFGVVRRAPRTNQRPVRILRVADGHI
jgi:hypothetical protein